MNLLKNPQHKSFVKSSTEFNGRDDGIQTERDKQQENKARFKVLTLTVVFSLKHDKTFQKVVEMED